MLLHGAFRGGWAWDRVAPLLRDTGHQVTTPTLLGCGERYSDAVRGTRVRLTDWVADVATVAVPGAVLVGHSQGGVVALAAAAAVGAVHVVLLDAPMPPPGGCAADVIPAEVVASYGPPPAPTDWVDPVPLQEDPASGVTAELVAWANPLLTPSPAGPAYDLVPTLPGSVRRTTVFFSRTPAYFPCGYTRAAMEESGEPYALLDAGHDAPLTHPELVAAALNTLLEP